MAEIFQYIKKEGVLHRLTPATKVAFLIVVLFGAMITSDLCLLSMMVIAIFAVGIIGRLHRELLSQIPFLLILSALLIILTVLTMQSGEVLGYLLPGGYVPVTSGALIFAGILSLRFFSVILAFQIVIISTQPRDLVGVFEAMKVPTDYSLMLLIAMRFIPSLQIEGRRIHEAQKARGYDPGSGLGGRVRSLAPVMVPLVSNALGKATVLGLTIDLRGLRTHPRTPITRHRFGRGDLIAVILMIIFILVVTGRLVTKLI